MQSVLVAFLSLVGGLVVVAVWLIAIYNGLVTFRNRYKNAYAQIDVQLNRRYDLIPNLVECVKGYMSHERETLDAVIQARNSAVTAGQSAAAKPGDPEAMKGLSQAEAQMNGALGRLFALSEAYPELKANTNMLALQEELTSTENKVGYARQAYNDAVTAFNNSREVFPAVLVAPSFGFGPASLLEIEAPVREPIKVSFK